MRFANKDRYLLHLYRCPGEETYSEVYRPFRAGIDGDSIEVGFGRYPVPSDPSSPGSGGETFPADAYLDSPRAVLDRSTLQSAMKLSPCVVSGRVIDRVIPERGRSPDNFSVRLARSKIYWNVRAVALPETLEIHMGPAPGSRWRTLGIPSVEVGDEVVIGLDSDSTGFHFVHPILSVAHLLADGTAVSILQRSRCGAGADTLGSFVPASLRR